MARKGRELSKEEMVVLIGIGGVETKDFVVCSSGFWDKVYVPVHNGWEPKPPRVCIEQMGSQSFKCFLLEEDGDET